MANMTAKSVTQTMKGVAMTNVAISGAGSSDLLCQVPDVLALGVFTGPPNHLRHRQLPIGLEDRPRAGDPAQLDRLEPRALDRQTTSHDPHTPSRFTRRWCAWIQARTH